METEEFKIKINGRILKAKFTNFAEQTNGNVFVQYGNSLVMSTVVRNEQLRQKKSFFPLTVEYEEKFYAGGQIKGVRYTRREGRASDQAILNARIVDRAIRPCFPKTFIQEVQLVNTCFSWDRENSPDIIALIGASLAISISDIPWQGPVGAVRVIFKQEKFIINPTYQERDGAELDLILTGIEDPQTQEILINMIDGQGTEIEEEKIIAAVEHSKKYLQEIINWQKNIISKKQIGEKLTLETKANEKINDKIRAFLGDKLVKALFIKDKTERSNKIEELEQATVNYLSSDSSVFFINNNNLQLINEVGDKYRNKEVVYEEDIESFFEQEKDCILHQTILQSEERPDGRLLDEIRPITCQIDLLPCTHGSGFFKRGQTNSLSILTLASPGNKQFLDGMEISGEKHFIHHYNFPPYSTGEIKPMQGPKRRDIGHGMLAEKALLPVIPNHEIFPYTIRIVSEILSSNGSSSMASVCSASLSLMAAGVPIKTHVAGIALGLIVNKENKDDYKILVDIQGPEDHYGDMDFKVAGTTNGVTAIQMDVKINGITIKILEEALIKAKKARQVILKKMDTAIGHPRAEVSKDAPKVICFKVNPNKVKNIIGPGGNMINKIIEICKVEIDIDRDSKVCVTAENEDFLKKAVDFIKDLVAEAEVGKIYQGKVVKIIEIGAFVEIFPGQDGMIHISKLSHKRVDQVKDVVKVGDKVEVLVEKIDEKGRVNLLLKKILH